MEINLNIAKDLEGINNLLSKVFDLNDKYEKESNITAKADLEDTINKLLTYIVQSINSVLKDLLIYKINNKECITKIGKDMLKEHFSNTRPANELELKLQSETCLSLYKLLNNLYKLDKDYIKLFFAVI